MSGPGLGLCVAVNSVYDSVLFVAVVDDAEGRKIVEWPCPKVQEELLSRLPNEGLELRDACLPFS